jgi:hypothetical protein
MPGLTPEDAGEFHSTGGGYLGQGYSISEVTPKYGGYPASGEQRAGVPGDPSGSISPPGSPAASPAPRRTPGDLTGRFEPLDPGPPEKGATDYLPYEVADRARRRTTDAPKFGPGAPCAFNGGIPINHKPPRVVAREATAGPGVDAYAAFSSTPVPFVYGG